MAWTEAGSQRSQEFKEDRVERSTDNVILKQFSGRRSNDGMSVARAAIVHLKSRLLVSCGLVLCLLFVTGCDEASPVGPAVPLSQRFPLGPGDSAPIAGTSLRVQFLRVSGDSRCPADALCIQGGDAIVHVRATESTTTDYELHTGGPPHAATTLSGFRIELAELQPYPFSSRTIQPGDYRATLT